MSKIKIKRGLKAGLPTLDVGELAYATDTDELFVGTENGNVSVEETVDVSTKYAAGVIETKNTNNTKFWVGTQFEYDASTPDENTIHFIKGDDASYRLGTVTYDNLLFDAFSQDEEMNGLVFNNDGTKMFMVGGRDSSVHQYTLSTPFNVGTASYDNVNLDTVNEIPYPQALAFSNDGTKMFIVGSVFQEVNQYTLSTSFDLSTASYDNVSFSVGSQDSNPTGLTFNNDGTKMFIVGTTSNSVHQYTLSTPFDLSTASYNNVSFDISSKATSPQGLTFNSNGTTMFIANGGNATIYQYILSTAFNVETAISNVVTYNTTSQEGYPTSLTFNNDGTKMFIVGNFGATVHQYTNEYKPNIIQNIYFGII